MLSTSIIGIGNCGSQVAALAKEKLNIDAMVINSSEKDLQTIPDTVHKSLIGDEKGAGKERSAAKVFLKESIMSIINDDEVDKILNKEIIFIVSSTGGGTGSGTSIILANILSEIYSTSKIIIVGVLPTLKEALSTQLNTIEYLTELYTGLDKATYMLYDNDKLAKKSSTSMMKEINESIVKDIDVIRGTYQRVTPFSSIDEKDMSNIISTSGRIAIASIYDLKEKDIDERSIEDLIIEQFKTNAHCELQRDNIVHRTGVIINSSERISEMFDTHIPKVQGFIGSPVEEFEHVAINKDRHEANNIFLIAAGLTQINDRIAKVKDRIDEINELQNKMENEDELVDTGLKEAQSKIERKEKPSGNDNIDIKGIFSKFM